MCATKEGWSAWLPAETQAPEETQMLGGRLAEALQPGDIVALYGDLGAGKTQLVKGLCQALGVPAEQVSSPTFTLVNEYHAGRFPIYHFDAYRIAHIDELFELGYEDYFYGSGLTIIEWPERVEPLLPPETYRLHLAHVGPTRRRITIHQPAEHG